MKHPALADALRFDNRRGLTLLTSMILLIVMSLIGVVAVDLAVQETKIADNFAGSNLAVAWAEAGAEAARLEIVNTENAEMAGFSCPESLPFAQRNYHYYPNSMNRRVRYCVELIGMNMVGASASGRVSGQESGAVMKTYFYKVDAYSLEPDKNSQNPSENDVVIRHVQTFEQQTRAAR